MPYYLGTATSHLNLLEVIVGLLTNATWMGTGNAWTVLANTTSGFTTEGYVCLRAPGLSGANEIFVNLTLWSDGGVRRHLILQGATGYTEGQPPDSQPGAITAAPPRLLLHYWEMPYTFVADAEHFSLFTQPRISPRIDQIAYCGLIRPYGGQSRWALPLFVGGMAHSASDQYTDTDDQHTWWARAYADDGSDANGYLRTPAGAWARCSKRTASGEYTGTAGTLYFADPTSYLPTGTLVGATEGGNYPLFPLTAILNLGSAETAVGEWIGWRWVPNGALGGSEAWITVGAPPTYHMIVQNAHRTDAVSVMALELGTEAPS